MPTPEVEGGEYLLSALFEFGPATKDGPAEVDKIEAWGRALAIKWKPWQLRLLVRLSRDYCVAQHEATKFDAPCPWPEGEKMWQWVIGQRNAARTKEILKQEIPADGNRKRR